MGKFLEKHGRAVDFLREDVYNKTMEKYCHKKLFDVGFCDVDFKDELKPSYALACFEEAACTSAEELGFGYSYLKPLGYAFMVTEVRCEFLRPIKLNEKIAVKTWPQPPSYVIFGREYVMESVEGEKLINASSKWCLFDLEKGKLLPSKVLPPPNGWEYNADSALSVQGKIPRLKMEEGELRFSLTIANSECDHNMHVNNTKYADYCFNCFSMQELSDATMKSFAISYIKQCKEGEMLRFYRKESEKGTFLVSGFNEAGEIVVCSQIQLI